jgi:hypothetical protein
MSDIPDNVVSIETRFSEAAPVTLLRERWDACRHEHTWLDGRLRTVGCRDCGEEHLDPFAVLESLALQWSRWQREAETLRKLNTEYHSNQRAQWERARDRHLGANPLHMGLHFSTQADGTVVPRDYVREDGLRGVTIPRDCRRCGSLTSRFDSRWIVSRA